MISLVKDTILYVLNTLVHDAVPLAFGIIVASALNVYVKPEKFRATLMKRKGVSILGSVAFGAFTPLCSCGTMAIIVSMLTTVLPWGPIMAFITSSPLMSPDLFVMLCGIINVKFAVALTVSSIFIGLSAGYISSYLEKHTTFFDNQVRFAKGEMTGEAVSNCCSCSKPSNPVEAISSSSYCSCSKTSICEGLSDSKPVRVGKSCCSANDILKNTCCTSTLKVNNSNEICCTKDSNDKSINFVKKYKLKELLNVFINIGIKRILLLFSVFAAVGYFINRFVPASVIMSLFGSKNIFSVPLAALIGVPLYVSDAGAIPIIKALLNSGASSGAILAFMITGPGTSIGAIVGSLTIMKRKAVLFSVSILLVSAILLGYLYNLLLFIGL